MTLAVIATTHLRTMLGGLAVTRVSNLVGTVVTEAVSDAINSGEIQYNNLISLEKNTSGGIAAMQSNMAEFNRLQSAITQDILN
ncbi:MAG: sporulation protein YunB, partial [Oscillospiraceae bacterium]|nr:sporulation protein YunB [Oscillospiraceae bacterium]